MEQAQRLGIAYKVSGAGGGDVGLAFSADPGTLGEFERSVGHDFDVVALELDEIGLSVETTDT